MTLSSGLWSFSIGLKSEERNEAGAEGPRRASGLASLGQQLTLVWGSHEVVAPLNHHQREMYPQSFLYPAVSEDFQSLSTSSRCIRIARHSHCSACGCRGLHPPDGIPIILDDSDEYQDAVDQAEQADIPTDDGFWMLCACGHGWDEHGAGTDVSAAEMARRTRVAMRIDELLADGDNLADFDYTDTDIESLRK